MLENLHNLALKKHLFAENTLSAAWFGELQSNFGTPVPSQRS